MQNVHRSFFSLGHLRFFGIFPWILDDPWQSLVRALNLGETIVSFVCIRSLMSTAVKVLLPSVTDQNSGACSREEINQKNRLIKIKLMWLLLRLAMFHSGFCIFICSILRKHFAVFLNSWLICFFLLLFSAGIKVGAMFSAWAKPWLPLMPRMPVYPWWISWEQRLFLLLVNYIWRRGCWERHQKTGALLMTEPLTPP